MRLSLGGFTQPLPCRSLGGSYLDIRHNSRPWRTDHWGKGYGKEAFGLLIDYGFRLLNLNSIMLGVMEFNQAAHQSYQTLGFKEIGRRRQARLVDGIYYDVIFMDLLSEEWHETYLVTSIQDLINDRKK